MPDGGVTNDEIARRLDEMNGRLAKVLDDHEQRLRTVERWVYAIPPTLLIAAASVVAAIVTAGGK